MIKNKLSQFFLLSLITFFSNSGIGATLSIDPESQTVSKGDIASIDLTISGLGDLSPPSIGAFLSEITFDSNKLAFDSLSYTSLLGDPNNSLETDITTVTNPGVVSLDEVSFLSSTELDALQPDQFSLATLNFTIKDLGPSSFGYGSVDLSDAIGSTVIPLLEGGTITAVPLPPAISLMFTGIFGIYFAQRTT